MTVEKLYINAIILHENNIHDQWQACSELKVYMNIFNPLSGSTLP
jgi:hypothetical protein